MREPWQPRTVDLRLAEVLNALADSVRLEIVAKLAEVENDNCGELGNDIDVHKSTMSHHYRVLREAGITNTVQQGRSRLVSLRRDDLDTQFPGLLDSILKSLAAAKLMQAMSQQ